MPRSKRDKTVSLSKTKKKVGRERKEGLVKTVRQCVDEYAHLFVFSVRNMRSSKLVDIRREFKSDSRFVSFLLAHFENTNFRLVFGKKHVMALALGRIREEEYAPNLYKVAKHLTGPTGLLFTHRSVDEVKRLEFCGFFKFTGFSFFTDFTRPDFARDGNRATSTVRLEQGPLEQFSFSMEPQLRKLGLPTALDKGVVVLTTDHIVCEEGEPLTPEAAKILKLLDIQMIVFSVKLLCCWTKATHKFTRLVQVKKTDEKDSMQIE